MPKITYNQAKREIPKLFKKYPPGSRQRKGVIDSILWSVAQTDGPELANALIILFDLQVQGGHTYFDT